MSLSEEIKEFALSIGYDRVGFATTEDFTFYQEQVSQRKEMYDWAIDGSLRLLSGVSPRSAMPEARSIVVTVTDYFKEAFPESLVGKIGRVYQARVYLSPSHVIHRIRYGQMREFLQQKGLQLGRTIQIPARLSGARAGLTTFGRNNFAFAGASGSYLSISTFLVDAELEYGESALEAPCPKDCRRCIEACPTGALYEPFRLNPRQCVAYNSYAVPGPSYGQVSEFLPLAIREKMGTWLYGCDACQDACPRNQRKLKAKLPPNEYLAKVAGDFDPYRLLNLSDEHFAKKVMAVLYYINEKKYYQRNAAVVLGNIGDPEAVPALSEALHDPEPVVRGHAAWALGKIGGPKSLQSLEAARSREKDMTVQQEIRAALERATEA